MDTQPDRMAGKDWSSTTAEAELRATTEVQLLLAPVCRRTSAADRRIRAVDENAPGSSEQPSILLDPTAGDDVDTGLKRQRRAIADVPTAIVGPGLKGLGSIDVVHVRGSLGFTGGPVGYDRAVNSDGCGGRTSASGSPVNAARSSNDVPGPKVAEPPFTLHPPWIYTVFDVSDVPPAIVSAPW